MYKVHLVHCRRFKGQQHKQLQLLARRLDGCCSLMTGHDVHEYYVISSNFTPVFYYVSFEFNLQ